MRWSRIVFLVDMQSFYASIEKAADPKLYNKPVVVAGDPKIRSGVVLAACPLAKQWGVKTAETLWEAEQKCPHLVVVKPRMQTYINISIQITDIIECFSDLVEPFSVDEQFVDMTHTLHLFGGDVLQAARQLQQKIHLQTGIYARVGIGPNKVLAKMACSIAKKDPRGIFYLHANNMKDKLWPLPIGEMFGVGSRMRHHLERRGIRTIGHLANYPLKSLKKRWGINGEVLWRTANGIDDSPVSPTQNTHARQKALGHHMTLPRDYSTLDDIKVILLELSEEVARRARSKQYMGRTLSVGARGYDLDFPTGFNRQMKLLDWTNDGMEIYKAALRLFEQHWGGYPVRSVGVTLSSLTSSIHRQLNLFHSFVGQEKLNQAIDTIKDKYGASAILRAASITHAGQAKSRAQKIGGHYK